MIERLLGTLEAGGEKPCYKIGNETLTYYACYVQVRSLAAALRRNGSGPVLVYGEKGVGQFVAILACVVARRCYVPVDVAMPHPRVEEIVQQAQVTLVLADAHLQVPGVPCMSPQELLAVDDVYRAPVENGNDLAYIIFTSGSTGKSKGVPISYENLDHFISWVTEVPTLQTLACERVLSVSQFGFDLSVMDIYFSLFTGRTIVAVPYGIRENMARFFSDVREESIDFMVLTPTLVKLLLLDSEFDTKHFPVLSGFFFCGECLEVETARKLHARFPEAVIINAYGPTECTCCVSMVVIDEAMLTHVLLPVGVIQEAAVEIALADDEIVLRGESVFAGYLSMDSAQCCQENGVACFYTRDVGIVRDGLLYCRGRKDQQIKCQGYRIELGDIEAHLLQISGVNEAVVCAKRKGESGVVRLLKAYVVTESGAPDASAIKIALARVLPAYMIPKTITCLDALPVTANGKYDRKKLETL